MFTSIRRGLFIGTVATLILIGAIAPRFAAAQAASDSKNRPPTEQELADQMAALRERVLANMIAQGIDPRDFFEEVRKASPDGGFDLDIVKQKLVEKGLVDQETVDRMQASVQQLGTSRLKQQLGVSDDEWAALLPRIQKVVDAAYAAGIRSQRLEMMGLRPTTKGPTEVGKAMQEMRDTSKDSTANPQLIAEKLNAWRTLRQQAEERYAAAQKELVSILTRRQEGVLVMAGLLQ